MDWRSRALFAVLLYGGWGYLGGKSAAVTGPRVACFLQMCAYAVMLTMIGFGRADFARTTRHALLLGALAAACAAIGTYQIFTAAGLAPDGQRALVYIISDAYPLIVALLMHFLDKPLHWRAWLGAVLISGGMALIWGVPQK